MAATALPAVAQTAPALGEWQAVEAALSRSEVRTADEAARAEAEARRWGAMALPDPHLEIGREGASGLDSAGAEDHVVLSAPLDVTGAWIADRAAARAGFAADVADIQAARAGFIADVRRAFHRLAAAMEVAAAAQTRLSRLEQAQAQMRLRLEAGDVSALEAARIDADRLIAAAEAATALADADAARLTLQALTGHEGGFAFAAILTAPLPEASELRDALDSSPLAASWSARAQSSAEAARAAGRRAWAPGISVQAGLRSVDDGMGAETGGIVGLEIAIPLFGRSRAEAEGARAAARRASAEASMTRAALEAEALSLLLRAAQLEALLTRQTEATNTLTVLQDAGLAAFEAGEIDVTAWLDGESAAFEQRVALAELELEARLARVALDEILGLTED
jgi:outer membrane protein, heavy metal efflux system